MLRRLVALACGLLALVLAAPLSPATADDPTPTPAPSDVELTLTVPHAEVGVPTAASLTAVRDGEPVPGLVVEVTRTGPEPREPSTTTATTDEAGVATFEVLVTSYGEFSVVATVTEATGAVVGTAGPVVAQGYVLDSCGGGYPGRVGAPARRCSPPEPWLIRTKDARNGDDRILLEARGDDAVEVRLLRHRDGSRQRIRVAVVAEDTRRWFRVTDHNGPRPTRYSAVLVPPDGERRLTRTFHIR